MSANASLAIRIAAIFDNKGLKQADKGVKGLQASVKKLAGAAGIGLSTAAVINFGKQSMKAFAENEKSAARLAGVVKNLGLAMETPTIEASLDRISAKYGYQGEVLREAYQKLITATGSLEKSQELLNLSLDIAAGSGENLVTVNQDLANLFIGNTKGLKKYNLGLSQAQLKTLKFDDAVALLNKTFKSAGEDELNTYSGQMRVLTEAAGSAQEIIGGGLIDALMILSGDTTVAELAETMNELATNTATALTNLGKFGKGVVDTFGPIATALEKFIIATQPFADLIIEGDPSGFMDRPRARARRFFTGGQDSILEAQRAKARAVAEAEALKRAKERAALEKKAAMEARKKAALEKAARTLELERINLTAGLKGKISESDRLSLQLQLALLDKNDALATELAKKLDEAVKRNNELAAALRNMPKAPNPYEDWKIPAELLNYTAATLGVSSETVIKAPESITATSDATQELIDALIAAAEAGRKAEDARIMAEGGDVNIKITLPDGTDVTGSAKAELTNQALSGSFIGVNRTGRFGSPVAL
jgi:hypothetical protein